MKKLSKVAVLSSTLIMSSSALALDMDMSGYYYHVQYAMLDLDVSNTDGSGTASVSGVAFEIGKNVYEHELADVYLEGVVVLGLEEATAFGSGSVRNTAGLDGAIGVQAKVYREINEDFAAYVNIGIMNVSTSVVREGSYTGSWVATAPVDYASDTGAAFALGGEYQLNSDAALTVSYNSYAGGSDVDVTSLNFGYKANF